MRSAYDNAKRVLSEVQYKDWTFVLKHSAYNTYLQVQFQADGETQHGRKWILSQFMTDSEIVQTAFMAVLAAEEHEAREKFLLQGVAVLGPHFDLYELANKFHDIPLDVREDPV